jgi:hypothetical protein
MTEQKDTPDDLFFNAKGDLDALFSVAAKVCSPGVPLSGCLFGAEQSLDESVASLKEHRRLKHRFVSNTSAPYVVTYKRKGEVAAAQPESEPKCYLWRHVDIPVVYALTCQHRDVFSRLSDAMYRVLLPGISRIHLRTVEFLEALNGLSSGFGENQLRVREYVARSLIEDDNSHKNVETNRQWTDKDYPAVFDELRRKRAWLSSIRIEVRGPQPMSGRICRDSTFVCHENFPLFFRTVLNRVAAIVARRRGFYDKRDRRSGDHHGPRPIEISYDQEVFADKQQHGRLIQVITSLPNASFAVFHGNPYLHGTLVDYTDGSSYDIWIATATSILIVPKARATSHSLSRVCNHICDRFQEGEVREYQGQ